VRIRRGPATVKGKQVGSIATGKLGRRADALSQETYPLAPLVSPSREGWWSVW